MLFVSWQKEVIVWTKVCFRRQKVLKLPKMLAFDNVRQKPTVVRFLKENKQCRDLGTDDMFQREEMQKRLLVGFGK